MAEFMANNNDFLSTRLSPFFVLRNLYPRICFNLVNFLDTTIRKRINKNKAIDIFEAIKLI